MYSMTGFGKGEAATPGGMVFSTEISSVNRKQLELRTNLPAELAGLDAAARAVVTPRISRGAVTLRMTRSSAQSSAADVRLNLPLLEKLAADCLALRQKMNLAPELDVAALLTLPGVVISDPIDVESEEITSAFALSIERALERFLAMRAAEGESLRADLKGRLTKLRALRAAVEPFTRELAAQLRQKLLDKLESEKLLPNPNDERVLREILFYADRVDVSEELTRLDSHFEQFEAFLAESREPVGRSLDFLVQEMFREINTLGNKAGSSEVSHIVVAFKSELEKIREQVQNIE